MSPAKHFTESSRANARTTSHRPGQTGDADFSDFDLKATLNTMVVREANFSEFLAAIKAYGRPFAQG